VSKNFEGISVEIKLNVTIIRAKILKDFIVLITSETILEQLRYKIFIKP
jgi:hypothetical protein